MGQVQDIPYRFTNTQEWNVPKAELIVCNDALKLHAKAFGVLAGLYQEGCPVGCTVWIANHQLRHVPRLGNNIAAYEPVYPLIVSILLGTGKNTCIPKVLLIHILGEKDTSRCYLCILVVLQHRFGGLLSHQLHSTFHVICCKHGRRCLPVYVYGIVANGHHRQGKTKQKYE